jgi:small ligand-binding sensory domain FIST
MAFAAAAALDPDASAAADRLVADVSGALPGGRADVAFLFVGRPHAGRAEDVLRRVRAALGDPVVVGCTAGGVIGGGREHEAAPALSLLAGRAPGTALHPFAFPDAALPDADAGPAAWHALVGAPPAANPSFVVVADPTTTRADALLRGLDFAYPGSVKVGGLASGADRPGGQALFAGDRVERSGVVGVAFSGALGLSPAVAQGCRPIGPAGRITDCEGNLLRRIDGATAVEALRSALAGASERDRALARTSLFLGFETDPFGAQDDAWLVRNIAGADRAGGLWVGEALRVGRRVRFQVRDRVSSSEDLERTLEHAQGEGEPPEAALLFSCLGRGMPLYGTPDHDSRTFRARFGDVPIGGFFCAGEIGPVGGSTYLHGYTSSFGLLRPSEGRGPAPGGA